MTSEKEIEELKKELNFYKNDPEKRGYFALRRIVNLQIDYLNSFNIKENVGGKASEDATFIRTQGMWENLPKMISSLSDLKIQLKINPEDEEKETKRSQITPESMANSINK